ncbi:twin-arginine translocase TatA/TatE family subunit [bacterium]|nr:twin-arginine translocase TatA/TatE family subunit [bacterium]
MPSIGFPELLLFAGIILLLFGSRIPSVMRSLGSSITEFKKGTRDAEQELEETPKS